MTLPADSHVHSQWSWDAAVGDMEGSCARAVELRLPAIAFTRHLDHTVWTVEFDGLDPGAHLVKMADPDGLLTPPPFDVPGYLAADLACHSCRDRYPPGARFDPFCPTGRHSRWASMSMPACRPCT